MVKPVNKASSNTKVLLDKYTDKKIASMLDPEGNKLKAMTSQEHKKSTADIIDIIATEQILGTLYKEELKQINKPNQPDTLWGKYKNLWKTHPIRAATYGAITFAGAAATTFMAVLIGDKAAGGDISVNLGLDSTFFSGGIDADLPASTNALGENDYLKLADTSNNPTAIDITDSNTIEANNDIRPAEIDDGKVVLKEGEEVIEIQGNKYLIDSGNQLVKQGDNYYIITDEQGIYALEDGKIFIDNKDMQVVKGGEGEYLIENNQKLIKAGDNYIASSENNKQVFFTGEGGNQSFFFIDNNHHIETVNGDNYAVKDGYNLTLVDEVIKQEPSGENATAYGILGAGVAATALGVSAVAVQASRNVAKEGQESSFVNSVQSIRSGSILR